MEWELAQMDIDIKMLNKETPAYQENQQSGEQYIKSRII
jgi:hypothetical protein